MLIFFLKVQILFCGYDEICVSLFTYFNCNAYSFHRLKEDGTFTTKNVMGYVTLERNGKTVDPFPEEASMDRIEALKVTYLC